MSKYLERRQAVLLLEDGTFFKGTSIGKIGQTTGELCFNTGMTGYQEIFTDPSYYGQILVATHTHIGNYGINEAEVESQSIKISGLVCRNFNVPFARKQATQSIQDYFTEFGLV
ncbi:MAG: carbamoyl phosphate synthase small subunit, partial [Bacteroidetes bacterium]|nr:carbamoyl phosphate synthase small subunit [Bacteroidota bacterium]